MIHTEYTFLIEGEKISVRHDGGLIQVALYGSKGPLVELDPMAARNFIQCVEKALSDLESSIPY